MRCADWVECDTVGFSPLHSFSFRPLKLLAAPLPAAPPRAGLRVVQLLSWQQRLSALASQPGQLAAALLAAVRIYRAASTGGSSGQARQQPAGGAAWPADGGGAPPPEVQRQLLTILCAYVDQGLAALHQGAPVGPTEDASSQAAASSAQLADTAIGCCLLLRRTDALWSDLFPRFQAAGQQLGGTDCGGSSSPAAAFLHQLLPFILSDQLPSVAPEVGWGCWQVLEVAGLQEVGIGWVPCAAHPASAALLMTLCMRC